MSTPHIAAERTVKRVSGCMNDWQDIREWRLLVCEVRRRDCGNVMEEQRGQFPFLRSVVVKICNVIQ